MKLDKTEMKYIGISAYAFLGLAYLMYRFAVPNMANVALTMLIVFLSVYYVIKKNLDKKTVHVNTVWLWILSILFSIATVTGMHLTGGLSFSEMVVSDFVWYIFCIGGFTFVSKCLFIMAYGFFEKWAMQENAIQRLTTKQRWGSWIFAFVIILAAWLIVWLAYYPGLWNYDPYQVQQVMYGNYSRYHPILHTLFLGWCYVYGLYQGNANLGVIIYAHIQMMLMAGIFAYAYVYVKEHVSSKLFRAITLMFFALFPVNSLLALSTTKDTLYAGFVLVAMILALKYFEAKDENKKTSKAGIIVLLVMIALMMLFRNNAFYALLVTFVVAIFMMLLKHDTKKVLIFLVLTIVAFKSADFAIEKTINPAPGPRGEMLSVPSQQMGRIYYSVEDDEESKQKIEQFYRMEYAYYQPYLSDPMKATIQNIDHTDGIIEYLKTAAELLVRYPLVSIDSFLYLTQGYWDICDLSHADIYDFFGITTEFRFGYLLTTVYDGYGITPDSKLPLVEAFYEDAFTQNSYQNWPILPLIFAPAFYVWFLAFGTIVLLTKKKWNILIVYSFLWGYLMTLFLGPGVLIRYVYLLVVSIPVQIYILLHVMKESTREEIDG